MRLLSLGRGEKIFCVVLAITTFTLDMVVDSFLFFLFSVAIHVVEPSAPVLEIGPRVRPSFQE